MTAENLCSHLGYLSYVERSEGSKACQLIGPRCQYDHARRALSVATIVVYRQVHGNLAYPTRDLQREDAFAALQEGFTDV